MAWHDGIDPPMDTLSEPLRRLAYDAQELGAAEYYESILPGIPYPHATGAERSVAHALSQGIAQEDIDRVIDSYAAFAYKKEAEKIRTRPRAIPMKIPKYLESLVESATRVGEKKAAADSWEMQQLRSAISTACDRENTFHISENDALHIAAYFKQQAARRLASAELKQATINRALKPLLDSLPLLDGLPEIAHTLAISARHAGEKEALDQLYTDPEPKTRTMENMREISGKAIEAGISKRLVLDIATSYFLLGKEEVLKDPANVSHAKRYQQRRAQATAARQGIV